MMAEKYDAVQRLMQEVRDGLRLNMVNQYTCLTPRRVKDGVQVVNVKDGRYKGLLEITVREVSPDHE
jgi:hypothetical protein